MRKVDWKCRIVEGEGGGGWSSSRLYSLDRSRSQFAMVFGEAGGGQYPYRQVPSAYGVL